MHVARRMNAAWWNAHRRVKCVQRGEHCVIRVLHFDEDLPNTRSIREDEVIFHDDDGCFACLDHARVPAIADKCGVALLRLVDKRKASDDARGVAFEDAPDKRGKRLSVRWSISHPLLLQRELLRELLRELPWWALQ